jgi:hypothetical protein
MVGEVVLRQGRNQLGKRLLHSLPEDQRTNRQVSPLEVQKSRVEFDSPGFEKSLSSSFHAFEEGSD